MYKTCLYLLGRIAIYLTGGVDASQANLLKETLTPFYPKVELNLQIFLVSIIVQFINFLVVSDKWIYPTQPR